jgi:hypothetical protein
VRLRTLCSILLLTASTFAQAPAPFDWTQVESALGRKGTLQPGDVYKFGLPRTDLKISVGGIQLKPALALGGWLAFEGTGEECVVMGDIVVTEAEVPAVIGAALSHQIAITAIHNHVLNESPRVMYMHVGGHFVVPAHQICVNNVAKGMRDVIIAAHIPAATPPAPSTAPLGIDQAAIESAMHAKGNVNGGVLQFSIPRANQISMHGMPVAPAMGTATAINFQPVGGTRAAVTGDFVMVGEEVPNVMKALSDGGIEPTALHSHMIDEEPRLFFMHFWAVDDASKLAATLRTALDQLTSSTPAQPPIGAQTTPK